MGAKTWTIEQLCEAVKNNVTFSGILKNLGLRASGTMYKKVRIIAQKHGISLEHIIGRSAVNLSGDRIHPFESILVENSSYTSTSNLKRRLLNAEKLINKCDICGMGPMWNNKNLVMVLDHINGNSTDNRLENLRLLCPNCNSQQPTFAGRNHKNHAQKFLCVKCGKILKGKSRTGLCYDCYREKTSPCLTIDNAGLHCKHCNRKISKRNESGFCLSCAHIERKIINKTDMPSLDILQKEVEKFGCAKTGRKYGVSGPSIKKWLINYGYKFTYNQKPNSSGIKGITKKGNKWMAIIWHNGESIYIGTFVTPEEAQTAYKLKRQELGLPD